MNGAVLSVGRVREGQLTPAVPIALHILQAPNIVLAAIAVDPTVLEYRAMVQEHQLTAAAPLFQDLA